jgi:hypothetical protein
MLQYSPHSKHTPQSLHNNDLSSPCANLRQWISEAAARRAWWDGERRVWPRRMRRRWDPAAAIRPRACLPPRLPLRLVVRRTPAARGRPARGEGVCLRRVHAQLGRLGRYRRRTERAQPPVQDPRAVCKRSERRGAREDAEDREPGPVQSIVACGFISGVEKVCGSGRGRRDSRRVEDGGHGARKARGAKNRRHSVGQWTGHCDPCAVHCADGRRYLDGAPFPHPDTTLASRRTE